MNEIDDACCHIIYKLLPTNFTNLFAYRTASSSIWVDWCLSVWRPFYRRKNDSSTGKNKKEDTSLGKELTAFIILQTIIHVVFTVSQNQKITFLQNSTEIMAQESIHRTSNLAHITEYKKSSSGRLLPCSGFS